MTLVLVVDDDPATRRAIAGAFRSRGFESRAVANGRDALQALHYEAAGLRLPDIDGRRSCTAYAASAPATEQDSRHE